MKNWINRYFFKSIYLKRSSEYFGYLKRLLFFVTISPFFISILYAQEQKTEYKVIFHGDSVGNIQLYKNQAGDRISLKMVSNVQIHFFVKVKVQGEEESTFQGGRLIYSSVSRIVNGKEKASKQTKADSNIYQTTTFGKTGPSINKTIDYDLSMLYYKEPVNKQVVYSDYFQQFLTVEKVALHRYKIILPDGNYNYYIFSGGICKAAEFHHSFYTVYIQLKA